MAKRYAMVIDLNRCVGCNACTIECRQEWKEKVPSGEFRSRIKEIENGKYPNISMVYRRTACMHCADAPCVKACPYKVRYLNTDNKVNDKADSCNFCYPRTQKGEKPACTVNCVGNVFTFGDLNDPKGEVAKKVKLAKPLRPDLKTKPSVYYIPFGNRKWDVI